MANMKIAAVTPCDCASHAIVHLRDEVGIDRLEVRVDISTAQSIAAQLQGICGPDSCHSDLLDICLASQGARLEGVMLTEKPDGPHQAQPVCRRRAPGESTSAPGNRAGGGE